MKPGSWINFWRKSIAMSAGNAVLDVMLKKGFLKTSAKTENILFNN